MLTNPKNDLWCERYRPTRLEDLVLEDSMRLELNKFIQQGSIPHLLLVGASGCGKTTIAKILLSKLDCDKLELNASSERGVDVVRNKVLNFSMMQGLHKWKIVFLDEFDQVTFDAQAALRNIFEAFSEHTRFICTANYSNKVIPAIKSRCQILEFEHMDKKSVIKLLKEILEKEKVSYETDDFLTLVEDYYPDIRSMINTLQLDTVGEKFRYRRSFSLKEMLVLFERIKTGELAEIRKMSLDYGEAYQYLFNRVEELTSDYDDKVQVSLLIADHFRDEAFCADREINFAACCMRIMERLKIRVK